MRALLWLAKGLLSIMSFAGSLIRFAVYIAFALDIAALFICGFGYFIAFLIPIAIVWALPVICGWLITKCDEELQNSKEYGSCNEYRSCHKTVDRTNYYQDHYYEKMGYKYTNPDEYKVGNQEDTPACKRAVTPGKTASGSGVNSAPIPDNCKPIVEHVHRK